MTDKVTRVDGWSDDWFAVVRTEVVVRFNEISGRNPWRCSACGRHDKPTCPHQIAAAEAAQLKGL